jgi:aspartate kinase
MAHMGSKVLHPRCVQLGMKYNIPIQVLSSLGDGIGSDLEGTMIMDEIETMEGGAVTGISHDFNDAQLTVYKIKDEFGQAANILSALSDAQINKDMIIQPVSNGSGTTPMTLSVPK